MRDVNGDGIPDGAEVELRAKWVKNPVTGAAGSAYAGESRGGFADVGRTAIENTMRGGGDDVDAAMAGMRTERAFQPMEVMDQGRKLQGSATDVIGMMDRGRADEARRDVPFAMTGRSDQEAVISRHRDPYDAMQERTNQAHRIMTGGIAGRDLDGNLMAPSRDERLENARRIMSDMSQSKAKRDAAGAVALAIMGDERQERQLATDERIQTILSGGQVDAAKATAEGQVKAAEAGAGAMRFRAEQEAGAARDVARSQGETERYRADQSLKGQLEQAKSTLESTKYAADQETMRAREAARAKLDSIRAQLSSGAYQGELVRHDSGMIGVWDDEKMIYKWEKPPAVMTMTEVESPTGGKYPMPAVSVPMKIDKLPAWKQQTPVGNPPVAGAKWSPSKGGWVVLRLGADASNPDNWTLYGEGTSGAQPQAEDTVAIRAPNGEVRRVPRASAQKYIDKGGVVVQ